MTDPDDSLRVFDAERDQTLHVLGDHAATIYRVPPQARGLGRKEARRLAKAAGRGELPAIG